MIPPIASGAAADGGASLLDRGIQARAAGSPREALAFLVEVLSADPNDLPAKLELALALNDLGRMDEARALQGLMVKDHAKAPQSWHALAPTLLKDGHVKAGLACLNRVLALEPKNHTARRQLADIKGALGDYSSALATYGLLRIEQGDTADLLIPTALAHLGRGELDAALATLDQALADDPHLAAAHLLRARILLLDGRIKAGLDALEWRWQARNASRPKAPGTAWDGLADLTGKTILVWAESGLYENIPLLRHLGPLSAQGASIILSLPAPLVCLGPGLPGVGATVASGGPLPAGQSIDYNVSLPELRRLQVGGAKTIPADGFLKPISGKRLTVKAPATALLKVGLAWAGANGANSLDFGRISRLLGLPGLAFFSLQTGQRARDAVDAAHPALITDLSPTLSDLADLAARIAEMDVVVTIDGPVADLAGAVGVPALVLLPQQSHWRWQAKGRQTPWQPTATLARQTKPGDWSRPLDLAEKFLSDLTDKAATRRATTGQAQPAEALWTDTLVRQGDLFIDLAPGDGTLAGLALAKGAQVVAVEHRAAAARKLAAKFPGLILSDAKAKGKARLDLSELVPAGHAGRLVVHGGSQAFDLGQARPALVMTASRDFLVALKEAGLTPWHFPFALSGGEMVPVEGSRPGPYLAVADGEPPIKSFGDTAQPGSVAAIAQAKLGASRLAALGTGLLIKGDLDRAGRVLAQALVLDADNAQANANLANLLRRIGRGPAAIAAFARASANGSGVDTKGNLANALREAGRYDEAERVFTQALKDSPKNPRLLYGYALLLRETGRAAQSLARMDQAHALDAALVPPHWRATTMLMAGEVRSGFELLARADQPDPLYPTWDGMQSLSGKSVLVRLPDDVGLAILYARALPALAVRGARLLVQAPAALSGLLDVQACVSRVLGPQDSPDRVDYRIGIGQLGQVMAGQSAVSGPYLMPPAMDGTRAERVRIGFSWAASDQDRRLSPAPFLDLLGLPQIDLVSLQGGGASKDLDKTGTRLLVEDAGGKARDLAALAEVMAGLDLVVTIDGPIAHLAAALGRPVLVLAAFGHDWPWGGEGETTPWYGEARILRSADGRTWPDLVRQTVAMLPR